MDTVKSAEIVLSRESADIQREIRRGLDCSHVWDDVDWEDDFWAIRDRIEKEGRPAAIEAIGLWASLVDGANYGRIFEDFSLEG
jgi:hypothetical protein